MALGSDQMTTTTESVFIPEVWSKEVLRATEEALVMANLVKRYDSEVEYGDTLHIPNLSSLTAKEKSANSQVTLQAPNETEDTISIDQHWYVAFLVEDMAETQANYALQSEYTDKAGFGLAKKIDTDLISSYGSFTGTAQGSYGSDIGDSEIVGAIQVLDEADAPLEDRAFIVAPSQKAAIMTLSRFTEARMIGDEDERVTSGPDSRYLWGNIYGTPVYYTNQIQTSASSPTQTHNVLFHKEALALAMQKEPRTQAENRIDYLGTLVVVDTVYGYTVLREDFGVEVKS